MSKSIGINEEQQSYSKLLSSLFCSITIIALSILSLLNSQSLDFYSMIVLLKVVIPASFCFWFLGFVIGKILDTNKENAIKAQELSNDNQAYEIPSMFSMTDDTEETDDIENLEVL